MLTFSHITYLCLSFIAGFPIKLPCGTHGPSVCKSFSSTLVLSARAVLQQYIITSDYVRKCQTPTPYSCMHLLQRATRGIQNIKIYHILVTGTRYNETPKLFQLHAFAYNEPPEVF